MLWTVTAVLERVSKGRKSENAKAAAKEAYALKRAGTRGSGCCSNARFKMREIEAAFNQETLRLSALKANGRALHTYLCEEGLLTHPRHVAFPDEPATKKQQTRAVRAFTAASMPCMHIPAERGWQVGLCWILAKGAIN
jgi:hypothetical protein